MSHDEDMLRVRALFQSRDWEGVHREVSASLGQDLSPEYQAIWLVTRGAANYQQAEYSRCLASYDAALRVDSRCVEAWQNKAYLLACCPDPQYHDGESALDCAFTAGRLTHFAAWECVTVIGAAFARLGRFPEARGAMDRALAIAPDDAQEQIRATHALIDQRTPVTGELERDARRLRWGLTPNDLQG